MGRIQIDVQTECLAIARGPSKNRLVKLKNNANTRCLKYCPLQLFSCNRHEVISLCQPLGPHVILNWTRG